MPKYRHTYEIVLSNGETSIEHVITSSRATPDNHKKLVGVRKRGATTNYVQTRMIKQHNGEERGELESNYSNLGNGGYIRRNILHG
jgi:hypothetical protein